MGPMLAGMEIGASYVLPGQVTDAEGYTIDGSTISAAITDQDLLKGELDGPDPAQVVVQFTPADWAGGAEAAWQAELENAKAQWQQIKGE